MQRLEEQKDKGLPILDNYKKELEKITRELLQSQEKHFRMYFEGKIERNIAGEIEGKLEINSKILNCKEEEGIMNIDFIRLTLNHPKELRLLYRGS